MRVAILGAGAAGLYLIKRRDPSAAVRVFEQNSAGATFGFGVVFSDRALEFLNEDDPKTFAAIVPQLESWTDITIVHRGERIRIDGVGFAAIGRLQLLRLLQARARSVGVAPTCRHPGPPRTQPALAVAGSASPCTPCQQLRRILARHSP